MKKNRIYIIGVILLVLIGMTLLFRNRKKQTNWRETYLHESDQPYGTELILKLIDLCFGDKKINTINRKLARHQLDDLGVNSSYIFIGSGLGLDTADIQTLLDYVSKGNTALIASKAIPNQLIYSIFGDEYFCNSDWDNYSDNFNDEAKLILRHPALNKDSVRLSYVFYRNKVVYNWTYIDDYYLCGNDNGGMLSLGTYEDDLTNFVQVEYGKGKIYLHTTPLIFTNFSLLNIDRVNYVRGVLRHLPIGDIYWDAYSNVSEYAVNPQANRTISRESPLQYILSQRSLTWAWYILLGLGLIYLIFRSKRRQRVIPITEKNENTSLEFLSTIGRLHFIRNSHKQLAVEKNKLFRSFIRRRYQIQGQELDEKAVDRLVVKSQIDKETIRKIVILGNNVDTASFVSENTLIDFHKALDSFYKNCK